MTDNERKAACEQAIQAALVQFACALVPTIARDTANNLYPDQMGIRLVVLTMPAPHSHAVETSVAVDGTVLETMNGAKVTTE